MSLSISKLFKRMLLLLPVAVITLPVAAKANEPTDAEGVEVAREVRRPRRLRRDLHIISSTSIHTSATTRHQSLEDHRKEEDEEAFLARFLIGSTHSSMPPTPSPSTQKSSRPTPSPTTGMLITACDPRCPCCNSNDWPEFVSVIEEYSTEPCSSSDCCYSRQNENNQVLVATECKDDNAAEQSPPYNVAYMSYDYTGSVFGCTPGQTCKLCGDSGFNLPPIVLTDEEAAVCESLLRSAVPNVNVCASDENGLPAPQTLC